ncbi:High mobility group protein 1.2 [Trichinella britovi]|uniref:High mobility group protein 1.2 n=2 Tax=Trichinella TaxID=6333 RepID=A0A0V1CPD1_TRIBR|nr:High mobility group protein 1.2 [Trichinella murrelli]KRX53847.1 High mobility group protein 1.2 [Trichinella sp. T9]KRY51157.1 High mobility group protein 1.2 [Trichinella britovi]
MHVRKRNVQSASYTIPFVVLHSKQRFYLEMVREAGKPRGKTTPYGFFVKMCYEEHKKKYPNENVQVTEVSKKCSAKWKTMTQEEKHRFYELAAKDRVRYDAELEAYGGDGLRKRKRSKKDPNAPKRALSAFFFFSNSKRAEIQQAHPDWKVGQVAQELGRMWKAIDEDEKRKFEDMAAKDRTRYEEDMKNYKSGGKSDVGKRARGATSSSATVEEDPDEDEDDDDEDED